MKRKFKAIPGKGMDKLYALEDRGIGFEKPVEIMGSILGILNSTCMPTNQVE